MTWPNSRLTTYAANAKVKSSDLNTIQDSIISLKHGLVTMIVPINGIGQNPALGPVVITLTSPNFAFIPIPGLKIGSRILAIRVKIRDSATGPTKLTALLRTWNYLGSSDSAFSNTSLGTGASQTLAVTGLTTIVATGNMYYAIVGFSTGTANCFIDALEVDFDRPS